VDEAGLLEPPLREVIAAHGLLARKGLGQHFLLDLNLTRRIARAAAPLTDTTVIEIGPGPGGLTRALLLEGARYVIAIERDTRCVAALGELAQRADGCLRVVEGDALTIDEQSLLELPSPQPSPQKRGEGQGEGCVGRTIIVANLPYNISAALLAKWLTTEPWPPWFQSLTLMFQREVADRLVAQPRTKAYGRLSLLTQWRTEAKRLFDIPARAFTPPPNVTSSVVQLIPREKPEPAPLKAFETVVATAFGQRRKMLRVSLGKLGDAEKLLRAAKIEPTARPEELGVAEFAALARAFVGPA
jgi:16S rRNA (adenine1518-N6/adenine1519-N6)-dimethyltransferase